LIRPARTPQAYRLHTAIQICVFTAFSLVPRNALMRKCCLIHLKNSSTCHLRRLSHDASHVVYICADSLPLGAVGLLAGRRSACHWARRDLFEFPDVTPDPWRVVHDGKYWTSGGVTSAIDVALSVLTEVVDGDLAQSVQLTVEYAPVPPFEAGRPESAPAHVFKLVNERLAESGNARLQAVRHAASLLVGHQSAVLSNQLSAHASDVVPSTAQTLRQY
jgi:transcriptional regulator GlxA family with amidase domain